MVSPSRRPSMIWSHTLFCVQASLRRGNKTNNHRKIFLAAVFYDRNEFMCHTHSCAHTQKPSPWYPFTLLLTNNTFILSRIIDLKFIKTVFSSIFHKHLINCFLPSKTLMCVIFSYFIFFLLFSLHTFVGLWELA